MSAIFQNSPHDSATFTGLPSSGFPKPLSSCILMKHVCFPWKYFGAKTLVCLCTTLYSQIGFSLKNYLEHLGRNVGAFRCWNLLPWGGIYHCVPPLPPSCFFLPFPLCCASTSFFSVTSLPSPPPPFRPPCLCLLLVPLLPDSSALHIIYPQPQMQIPRHPLPCIAVASDLGGLGGVLFPQFLTGIGSY